MKVFSGRCYLFYIFPAFSLWIGSGCLFYILPVLSLWVEAGCLLYMQSVHLLVIYHFGTSILMEQTQDTPWLRIIGTLSLGTARMMGKWGNVGHTFIPYGLVQDKLVRAACVHCRRTKCPLFTAFFLFFLLLALLFFQKGLSLGSEICCVVLSHKI